MTADPLPAPSASAPPAPTVSTCPAPMTIRFNGEYVTGVCGLPTPCAIHAQVAKVQLIVCDAPIAEAPPERVAEALYDALRADHPEGKDRPWVPGGNSLKQDEARRLARIALAAAAPSGAPPLGAREEQFAMVESAINDAYREFGAQIRVGVADRDQAAWLATLQRRMLSAAKALASLATAEADRGEPIMDGLPASCANCGGFTRDTSPRYVTHGTQYCRCTTEAGAAMLREAAALLDRVEIGEGRDTFDGSIAGGPPCDVDLFTPGPKYEEWARAVRANRRTRAALSAHSSTTTEGR